MMATQILIGSKFVSKATNINYVVVEDVCSECGYVLASPLNTNNLIVVEVPMINVKWITLKTLDY